MTRLGPAIRRGHGPVIPLLSRAVPVIVPVLLALPVLLGLVGALLPAFGYFPALGGTGLSLQPFRDLLAVPGLWTSVALSFAAGLLTTLISLAAALLFVAGSLGTRRLASARQAMGPLVAVPHAAAALGLALLIAPSGLVIRLVALPLGLDVPPDIALPGDRYGLSMMAGLVIKELPFLLLVSFAALPQADAARRVQLMRSLGYGALVGFTLAVWPAVYRQIRLPVLAVAAYASSVVDVALLLGPSTPAPLAVRLVGWMSDPDLSQRFMASAGTLLQCGLTLIVLAVWVGWERLGGWLLLTAGRRGRRFPDDRRLRQAAAFPVTLAGLLTILGLGLLALWSVAGAWQFPDLLPSTLSARTWTAAAAGAAGPLATTVAVAAAAAGLALLLAVWMLESRRRGRDGHGPGSRSDRRDTRAAAGNPAGAAPGLPLAAVLYLPLIVPQVAFVFGLHLLTLVAGLTPSLGLLVAVHLVFVLPYVALVLTAPWAALDPRYERIALALGRSRRAVFLRIRLPMLLAPLATAFAIGFAVSVGQYLPTLLIGAGRLPTITTEALALASGGNRRLIGAYALLQTAPACLVLAAAALLPALLHRGRRGMRG